MDNRYAYTAIVQYKQLNPSRFLRNFQRYITGTTLIKGISLKEIKEGLVYHKIQKILKDKKILTYELFVPTTLRPVKEKRQKATPVDDVVETKIVYKNDKKK